MEYEKFKQLVVEPRFWCAGSPLAWTTRQGPGIAHYAMDGRVGMFNLCYWLLDSRDPPPMTRYKEVNWRWLVLQGRTLILEGRCLEEHAAFKPQLGFQKVIQRHCFNLAANGRLVDQPNDVPWATLAKLALKIPTF